MTIHPAIAATMPARAARKPVAGATVPEGAQSLNATDGGVSGQPGATWRLVLPGYRPASWNEKITGWRRQELRRSADVAVGLAVRQLAEPPKFRRQVNILFVVYWGPKERRRDPDNLRAKPVIDSLRDVGVLVNDDPEWVYTYSARSLRDNKHPRTEIEITEVG